MKHSFVKFFLAVFCLFQFAGCGEKKDPQQNPATVGPNWSINDVTLDCENNDLCPDNQGMLIVVKRTTRYTYFYAETKTSVFRCTGTIYDLHQVILAGHCVTELSGAAEIWFKTVAKPGKPSRLFHVSATPAASTPKRDDFWLLDYGAITLKEAATGIEFAHPALTVPADTSELVALVSNPKNFALGLDTSYVLNAVTCKHGVNTINPVTYNFNPTMFLVTDCKLYGGNSGGALVLRNDPLSILGIASASNNATQNPGNSLYFPVKRTLDTAAPRVDQGIFTNARCISMPSWPKVESRCMEMNKEKVKEAVDILKRDTELSQQAQRDGANPSNAPVPETRQN